MNLKQTLYLNAVQTAASNLTHETQHAADSAKLKAFEAAGHDPADYPFWQSIYAATVDQLSHLGRQDAESEATAKKKEREAALKK